MLAIVNSCSVHGLSGYGLQVEVDIGAGLSAFEIVGLPDASVRESRERVRAALKNSGFDFPLRRIVVNLAPADIRKEGPSLDLPIAVGMLAASGQVAAEALQGAAFLGELSLDGALRPVSGVLPMAEYLHRQRGEIKCLYLPAENAMEASILPELTVYPVESLHQLVQVLRGETEIEPCVTDLEKLFAQSATAGPDMSEVRGQHSAKRALEIAAAGAHNALLVGPPGSGKTMLARRLPSIMPKLTLAESLEVTGIYSVCGMLSRQQTLITACPFRAPHHSASMASLIGGGANPRPGEISLASHGVLFLDEFPEFNRDVLEALRQPLEDRIVTVSRAKARYDFPANFQLVAAMNPCACGFHGDPEHACTCTPYQRQKYINRLSGPLLDRIDLHILVPRIQFQELSGESREESSADIRKRVVAARELQRQRFGEDGPAANSAMGRKDIERWCTPSADGQQLLESAFSRLRLSARAHDRILKVARTIADLAGEETISAMHIAEAIQYRTLDREEL